MEHFGTQNTNKIRADNCLGPKYNYKSHSKATQQALTKSSKVKNRRLIVDEVGGRERVQFETCNI